MCYKDGNYIVVQDFTVSKVKTERPCFRVQIEFKSFFFLNTQDRTSKTDRIYLIFSNSILQNKSVWIYIVQGFSEILTFKRFVSDRMTDAQNGSCVSVLYTTACWRGTVEISSKQTKVMSKFSAFQQNPPCISLCYTFSADHFNNKSLNFIFHCLFFVTFRPYILQCHRHRVGRHSGGGGLHRLPFLQASDWPT